MAYSYNHSNGNLISRKDVLRNLTETFTYDNLDRLDIVKLNGTITQDMGYNSAGSILSKSDMANTYTYNSTKIHQLQNVTGVTTAMPRTPQNITYTAFQKVATITDSLHNYTFTYGIDKQRTTMTYKYNGVFKYKRTYIGNYEQDSSAGVIRHIYYIYSPYGLVAMYANRTTSDTMYYICTDNQGSITMLTRQDKSIAQTLSYDAWGRRRTPLTWSYTSVASAKYTARGYTHSRQANN